MHIVCVCVLERYQKEENRARNEEDFRDLRGEEVLGRSEIRRGSARE